MRLKFSHGLGRGVQVICLLGLCIAPAAALAAGPVQVATPGKVIVSDSVDIHHVLLRAREAASNKTYVGTFVVLSSSGAMASSRIWHLSDGGHQVERMESLTGTPRQVFRRDGKVTTYLPDSQLARSEQRESFGLFPNLARVPVGAVHDWYVARAEAGERVTGFDTQVFEILPRDALRYGYRLWVERKTGFAVQLQTVDKKGAVLEQAAFSDLQFGVPLKADKMQRALGNVGGYRAEKLERVRTTATDEGWNLRSAIPGFVPMDCYKRAPDAPAGAVQWIFSDGLATVSLFIEPYGERPRPEWRSTAGITQMVGRRIGNDWWLTALGEVPSATLDAFAAQLERRP